MQVIKIRSMFQGETLHSIASVKYILRTRINVARNASAGEKYCALYLPEAMKLRDVLVFDYFSDPVMGHEQLNFKGVIRVIQHVQPLLNLRAVEPHGLKAACQYTTRVMLTFQIFV